MSLGIIDRGEGRYELFRENDPIGWIENRTLAFRGFENRSAARGAATVAYDALSGWLARERRTVPVPRNGRALLVRSDEGVDHLNLGEIPIGRILPLVHDEPDGSAGNEYSFELFLPPRLSSVVNAAQVAFHALERNRALRSRAQAGAAL